MSHPNRPEVLAFNSIADEFGASAAIVGKELFLRGKSTTYCIADETTQDRLTSGAVPPELDKDCAQSRPAC